MFEQKQTQCIAGRLPYESSVSLRKLRPAKPHHETVTGKHCVSRHNYIIVECRESNVDLACAIYRM
jgi:hypothetical protein